MRKPETPCSGPSMRNLTPSPRYSTSAIYTVPISRVSAIGCRPRPFARKHGRRKSHNLVLFGNPTQNRPSQILYELLHGDHSPQWKAIEKGQQFQQPGLIFAQHHGKQHQKKTRTAKDAGETLPPNLLAGQLQLF